MSQVTIKPDQLGKTIIEELNRYTENVTVNVNEAVEKVAKESKKKLRATRSVGDSNTWTKYPLGWAIKTTKRRNFRKEEVWNKPDYRLTHLLENGHVVRNGTGRNNGRQKTREFKHIGPINDEAQKKLEEAVMEAIERG